MQDSTILVIEDDRGVRETLAEVLADEGFRVMVAANGREGLDVIERGCRPAVILLDLMMPVMDGWQFQTLLLERFGTDIPIIVCTADGNAREKASAMHAAGYLRKPPTIEAVITAVGRYCA